MVLFDYITFLYLHVFFGPPNLFLSWFLARQDFNIWNLAHLFKRWATPGLDFVETLLRQGFWNVEIESLDWDHVEKPKLTIRDGGLDLT